MSARRTRFRSLAFIIGTVVVAVLGAGLGKVSGQLEPLMAKRIVGAGLSALLLLAGNALPKLVRSPGSDDLAVRGRTQASDLWAGRALLLGGLAGLAFWIFAPLPLAPLGAALSGLGAFGVALAAWWWQIARDGWQPVAPSSPRGLMAILLHTLAAGCAIFLTDVFLGDDASRWLAIGFCIVQGVGVSLWVQQVQDKVEVG